MTRQQRRAREREDAKRTRDRGYQKGEHKRDVVPQGTQSGRTASADPQPSNAPKSHERDVPKPRLVMPGGAMIGLAMAALMGGY